MKPGAREDSPEFDLVLACLRWPQERIDGERIQSLVRGPIRWPYLLEIVHHHKVVPLFFRNLEGFAPGYIPAEPAAVLRAGAVANAHTCLQRISHLLLLNRLFREREIDVRIFKGIPLAITAFQAATLRDAGDIDLLIAEKDLYRAGEVLSGEGYVRFEPQARLTPRRLHSYIAHQKDFSYEHPGDGIVIDLHWRLFRNSFLPANAGLAEVGEEWLPLGSERIATLPAPRLLLYLCVHGALDGWLRLKWLTDIGALLRTMTPEELASTARLAAEQQALPQLSAAAFLCQDLLGTGPPPPGCLDRNDRRVAHIMGFADRLMTSNQFRPIREQIPSTRWFLNEFRLHGSRRYRLDLVQRSLFRPRAWNWIDLPDALFPLYALISPFEWLSFHFRHRSQMLRRALRPAPTTHPRPGARVPIRRMMQVGPADIALAVEAACMLTFFRAALNFLPTQRLTAWMSKGQREASVSPAMTVQTIRRVEWSIDAVGRHAPLTFVCFPRSLAAYFMLRRRHIASKLFYGVAREADQLTAHTWVKVGDRTVVGGEVESQFTVLNTFP
ncbi:MAG: lasso peptide biosynthesis B2 protein [Acidobacteriaceae bacterium]|jgi:hypothetical protein